MSQIFCRMGFVLLMPFQLIRILTQMSLLFFPQYFRIMHNYSLNLIFSLTTSFSNIETVSVPPSCATSVTHEFIDRTICVKSLSVSRLMYTRPLVSKSLLVVTNLEETCCLSPCH